MNLSEFEDLLGMQGMMFLLLLIGILARKLNIVTESGKKCLMNLIIDIVLPCNIINSFDIEFSVSVLYDFSIVLVIALLIQVLCVVMSRLTYQKADARKKPVLQYATVCSNAGFMGNPIAETVFGSMGLLYASIYLIPQRIVMWSAGISYFTKTGSRKETMKKVATHPCIIAVVIGLLLMVTGVELPGFVRDTVKNVGGCCTALSMITIGCILADVSMKHLINRVLVKYTVIRLILIPLLVYLGCLLFHIDSLITGVSVVLAAMPAGSTTAILASQYDGDEIFATKAVVLTTILSLITIPIWCMILH